ncbi:MAG: amidohydrolase family protein [Clostridia bacterium]|nr:amidohydrolase family protein [Clostridia bacterium]
MTGAIVNAKILLEDGVIWNGTVLWSGDRIIASGRAEDVEVPEDASVTDARGLYAAPGLIDIHNHGGPDLLFHEDPEGCLRHVLRHGVTTVLPTLYCDLDAETLLRAISLLKEKSAAGIGRMIAGLYMEGPYMGGFGSNQSGLLWNGDIRRKDYGEIIEAAAGFARVWAIDPARPGIEGFMSDVRAFDPGAIFAMGHSRATAADCRKVKKYGLRLQTHHGDSGKAPGRNQVSVGAGCDEFTLYDPDIYAEVISDEVGIHLDPDMLKLVLGVKGASRVILISDSMPDKHRFRNDEKEGVLWGPDLNYDYEGHLAGSHLTLDRACRNMMAHTGCGICGAIRMATATPARLLGLDADRGSLEPGKLADVILTDDTADVKAVFFRGERA